MGVCVCVPPGCVLRLKKAFYGLKQAPRAWYQLVTIVLIDFGFTKCVSDPCLSLLNAEKTWLWSEVYVYDILKAGNNRAVINEVKDYIEYHFKIKNISPVKTMLGINIYHNVLDGLPTMDHFEMIK